MKTTIQKFMLLAAGIATVSVLASAPALAHHSTTEFDSSKIIKIEGTVTQFRWINPHVSAKLDGVADNGPDGLWTVEMTAANVLINQGWKRSSLKLGDAVTFFVNPLRNPITLKDGSQGGLYVGVVLADGTTLGITDSEAYGSGQ